MGFSRRKIKPTIGAPHTELDQLLQQAEVKVKATGRYTGQLAEWMTAAGQHLKSAHHISMPPMEFMHHRAGLHRLVLMIDGDQVTLIGNEPFESKPLLLVGYQEALFKLK